MSIPSRTSSRVRLGRRGRAAIIEELSRLPPGGFARAVANLLGELGFHYVQVRVTEGAAYVEVLGRDPDGHRVIVACRRGPAGDKLRAADVRAAAERVAAHPTAELGWVVTTSRPTLAARVRTIREGIRLVHGPALARLLAST